MVPVLQQRDRRPTATLFASERASRSWITTVLHAPKSSRRTSPKRLGAPIAICRRPHHLLSPKAQARENDATGLGFLSWGPAGAADPPWMKPWVGRCPGESRDPYIPARAAERWTPAFAGEAFDTVCRQGPGPGRLPPVADHRPRRSRAALPHIPPGPPNRMIRSGHSIRRRRH